ncbi:MAG TPA: hypothetical protein VGJ72_11050 [Polaromonas sp.]|jgi:hypothetical protein
MDKLNSRPMLAAVVAAALLAACGGGGGGASAPDPAAGVGQSVTATLAFIRNMIANNGENSEPVDISSLTLAVDDGAEPGPP